MSTQRDYGFPYEPYTIQYQLMDKIYESIDESKIAIIESPTGTGKSLSIICSMLKWMEDYKAGKAQEINAQIGKLRISSEGSGDSTDWVDQQLKQISTSKEVDSLNKVLQKFDEHIEYGKDLKRRIKYQKVTADVMPLTVNKRQANDGDNIDDDSELIVNYDEDDILDELDVLEKKKQDGFRPKIYYCSRTHSQLSQFINEVKKTRYSKQRDIPMMLVPLSSRVNYCANPQVNRYDSVHMINEKCNELQNTKQKCCLYKPSLLHQLNEEILADVQDLEDIVQKGKKLKACPYYASRLSIREAEIVVLPYNTLFHKGTRDSFGIDLKDSVVIVDEAHNLLETLASVYSIEVRGGQLKCLYDHLMLYLTRYYKRFSPTSLDYLKQIIAIVKKLVTFLKESTQAEQYSLAPFDFVLKLQLEGVNVYNLLKFIDQSHLASKLYMFSTRPRTADAENEPKKKNKAAGTLAFLSRMKSASKSKDATANAKSSDASEVETKKVEDVLEPYNSNYMYTFKEFLESLKNVTVEGKILVDLKGGNLKESSLKYVLLSASSHFKDILLDCRSVILCGGTMKPFDDYINQLFKPLNIPNDRILTFSCDHVIPPNNLVAIGCGKSPMNWDLNFSFKNRNSEQTIKQTGLAVAELCKVIPKGVVVFFASYDYADFVLKQWLKSGVMHSIGATGKKVFKEQRNSAGTATLLNAYTKHVNASAENGAILFSVIGGKMSEGINFSDNLGRGVVVIGLPYANRSSLELTAKMDYLNKFGNNLANEYYENLCMRAVNQSIGRAIRHQNDFAVIILLDDRYCHKQIVQNKLPGWIKSRFTTCDKFSTVTGTISKFFADKTLSP